MALSNLVQYCSSVKWAAMTAWASGTPTVGQLCRQATTPTVGNERAFVCIISGIDAVEPTWAVTKGATSIGGSATWMECTGQPAVNGDTVNSPRWTAQAKSNTIALGDTILDDAGTTVNICTTAGTAGSGAQPTLNKSAGSTTTDNTVTWTSLGPVANFAAWAASHARVENLLGAAWLSPGGAGYVDSAHTQTAAAVVNLIVLGTAALPQKILSVSSASAPPTALSAGAAVSCSGNNSFQIGNNTNTNQAFFYGFSFTQSGNAGLTLAGSNYEACSLILSSNNATPAINLGNGKSSSLTNCQTSFAHASQKIVITTGANIVWRDSPSMVSGTAPTGGLFQGNNINSGASVSVRGCDLSGLGANALVGLANAGLGFTFTFEACRLASGATATTGSFSLHNGTRVNLIRCDSSASSVNQEQDSYEGRATQDVSNYNDAGATDGTTRLSQKIVSGANSSFSFPLYFPNEPESLFAWNNVTGTSKTVSVEIMNDGLTLTNSDVWIEVEALTNASYPLGSTQSSAAISTPSIIGGGAGTAYTTSSATWTTSGITTPVKQTISVTFTPQIIGPLRARICLARPATTVYVDPLLTVT